MASLPDHLLPTAVGKERIPRDVVEGHQRQRVLNAATGVFARHGYPSTTVDQIVSAARIGVGSFYGLFDGKEDCFLRLYDQIVAEAEERIRAAVGEAPWADRVTEVLRALLELAAAEPDRARVVIVESRTAGPAGEARYEGTVARLVAALREGRSAATAGDGPPPAFEQAAIPGLAWALHQRLAGDEPVVVEELLPEMAGFVVSPYVESGISKR